MTNIVKHCRGEKKRGRRVIDGFRKKINSSRFWNFSVFRTWSQIKNRDHICKRKILEEYSVKIQADKNGCKYILFRIDFYFTEYFLVVEIDEKGHTHRDLIFEEKR